jgi:CO/xanthine dehydrogenase FAD-binding subunit
MVNHGMPQTLEEALILLKNDEYQIIAGGTDLMVQHRHWAQTLPKIPKPVFFIHHVKELNYLLDTPEYLEIGATTPMDMIMSSPLVPKILQHTIEEIAAPGIRHMATLAGNIANASPAADGLCTLIALSADLVIASLDRKRMIKVEEVISGPKRNKLAKDEMIIAIRIPHQDQSMSEFYKVGGRRADAISKVSLAAVIHVHQSIITNWHLAFGAVGPRVVHDIHTDQRMIGMKIDDVKRQTDAIIAMYEPLITPIDDQRSTAVYRKQVALNLIRRVIINLH